MNKHPTGKLIEENKNRGHITEHVIIDHPVGGSHPSVKTRDNGNSY